MPPPSGTPVSSPGGCGSIPLGDRRTDRSVRADQETDRPDRTQQPLIRPVKVVGIIAPETGTLADSAFDALG